MSPYDTILGDPWGAYAIPLVLSVVHRPSSAVPSLAIIGGVQRPAILKVRPALFISALPICWLIRLVQLSLTTRSGVSLRPGKKKLWFWSIDF